MEKNLKLAGLYFVSLCADMNATKSKYTMIGVTHKGEKIGDWEIIIRKKSHDNPTTKRKLSKQKTSGQEGGVDCSELRMEKGTS